MPSARGRISPLAIGAIFVVVFAGMHVGVQYARGDLLDRAAPTDRETRLRAQVWDVVDERRADRGLDPAQRDTSTRVGAQRTARRLAAVDYFEDPTAAGVRPAANDALPTPKGFCYRTPARLAVTASGWDAAPDGDGDEAAERTHDHDRGHASAAVVRRVAERIVDLFEHDAGTDVLSRSNGQKHGIGVAVDGDVVYVVYRTCNLGY
jgi:hypothetical protein